MVILDAISLDLDKQTEHLATDWVVSSDPDFADKDSPDGSNIVLQSLDNYTDKLQILFSENLDPNITYYAKARALLTTGWTAWGNVEVFKVRNNTDLGPQDVFPTRVAIPQIKTYRMVTDSGTGIAEGIQSTVPDANKKPIVTDQPTPGQLAGTGDDQEFNDNYTVDELLEFIQPGEHDLTLFEIWATGFQVYGNARHIATSWWIENREGKIVWSSLVNRLSRTKLMVKDIILKSNEIYRVRVVFHTNSNDVSQIGTYTIVTGGCEDIALVTYLDQVASNRELTLQIEWMEGVNQVQWEIFNLDLGLVTSIWKKISTTIVQDLPANTLEHNKNYLLRIRTNLSKCYKYIPFITTTVTDESPDDTPTPILVYPTDVTIGVDGNQLLFVESVATNITFVNEGKEFFSFNNLSKTITGIKEGSGWLYVRAKMNGYAENIQKVLVTVKAKGTVGGGGSATDAFISVRPDTVNLKVGESKLMSVSTNTKNIIVTLDNEDAAVASVTDKVITITGLKDGKFKGIVVGTDVENSSIASAPISGTVIDDTANKPEPEPEKPKEYTLTVEPTSLALQAGKKSIVKVTTNAPLWDVRHTEGDFFTYKKLNLTQLEVTITGAGDGMMVIVASSETGDVKEVSVPISANLQLGKTTVQFDQAQYEAKINVETEIGFTSNITSQDEYNVTFTPEDLVELIQKKDKSFVIKPKYEAAGKTISVAMTAKKNNSLTTSFEETASGFTLKIPNIVYKVDEVIKLPVKANAQDTSANYEYTGGIQAEMSYLPPNPVKFTIYFKDGVTEGNYDFMSAVKENGDGAITGKTPGKVITDKNSPYVGFFPVEFLVKTGEGNTGYGNAESTTFNITAKAVISGITYLKEFTISQPTQYTLELNKNTLKVNEYVTDDTVIITSNSKKNITLNTSDPQVAYAEYKIVNNNKTIIVHSGVEGEAIITMTTQDPNGVNMVGTLTVTVGGGVKPVTAPMAGDSGFGVGVAPVELLKRYNLTPLEAPTPGGKDKDGKPLTSSKYGNPEHENYGNYKDEYDNIMVFIPKMYFYYDNSSAEFTKVKSKILDKTDPWLVKASYTQDNMYFLDRCFINGGVEIDGIFLDKYSTSFGTKQKDGVDIPLSVKTAPMDAKKIIGKKTKYKDKVVTLSANDKAPYYVSVPKNRNSHSSWVDVYVFYLLYKIAKADYDAHLALGTESTHPWYQLPYHLPKVAHTLVNSTKEVTDPLYAHNSSGNGAYCLLGRWNIAMGLFDVPGKYSTIKKKQLYTYKITTDRSAINAENILNTDLYDKVSFPEWKDDRVNKQNMYKIAGKGLSGPVYYPATTISDINYILSSLMLTSYTNDIEYIDVSWTEDNIMKPDPRTRIVLNGKDSTIACIAHVGGSGEFSTYLQTDVDNNNILAIANTEYMSRICIIPNSGTTVNYTQITEEIIPSQTDDVNNGQGTTTPDTGTGGEVTPPEGAEVPNTN